MNRIEHIARQWLGTPFVPYAAQPGAGVDCVHLCGEILVEAGRITDYDFPRYRCDEGQHSDQSKVIAWLSGDGRFARLPEGSGVEPGDVLCFRISRVTHHVGLALDLVRFIHAMRGRGVILSTLRDPTYAKRFHSAWRPS